MIEHNHLFHFSLSFSGAQQHSGSNVISMRLFTQQLWKRYQAGLNIIQKNTWYRMEFVNASISMILSIVRDTRSRIAISVHAFELRGLILITVSEIINSNFSCKYKNIDIYSKKKPRFLRFYLWRCRSTIHERRQCKTLY